MLDRVPTKQERKPLSAQCVTADHEACGHRPLGIQGESTGIKVHRWVVTVVLCACECHAACELAAPESVPESLWVEQCSCPGRAAEVERRAAQKRERAERREQTRTVMAQARPEPGTSREDIRASVLQALQDRDLAWTPRRIDATVDALALAAGHRALVLPRIVGRTAMKLWKLRRAMTGAATDAQPPSESN
jgi:hypothetical protein